MQQALLSSKSNEWHTPDWLFKRLDNEFHFDLDAAATAKNAKCARFYSQENDALTKQWHSEFRMVWLNPPYGRLIGPFVKKAYEQCQENTSLSVVLLIPARVDTKWWHAYCAMGEVRFIKGRVRFENEAGCTDPAPFPSAIVILGGVARKGTTHYVGYKP